MTKEELEMERLQAVIKAEHNAVKKADIREKIDYLENMASEINELSDVVNHYLNDLSIKE